MRVLEISRRVAVWSVRFLMNYSGFFDVQGRYGDDLLRSGILLRGTVFHTHTTTVTLKSFDALFMN